MFNTERQSQCSSCMPQKLGIPFRRQRHHVSRPISHTPFSKPWPCDVAVFASLHAAYPDETDLLKEGGVDTINKAHIISLYQSTKENPFITKKYILVELGRGSLFPCGYGYSKKTRKQFIKADATTLRAAGLVRLFRILDQIRCTEAWLVHVSQKENYASCLDYFMIL